MGFVIFFGSFFLMVLMNFLPESFSTSAGGAKRWIRLPFFSLAPTEFFKVGFVFFLSWSLSRTFF
ncbi:Cell division protein FtsW [Helicobacter bizzozeronii CCUG 35545]|nr:Cell division protein FtsW [Helicobacter bizzozeronii CCUG 35545]